MALEPYARKRRFDSTPEPAGGDFSAAGSSVFCVQRHHARRLHYDLRIEVGGTLKSWAVPQGPTLDPSVKRLAVMVEDHPLEYASFEGTIPKGNYGAGSMMLWDRGRVEVLGEMPAEDQLARGDFKFALHGEKVRGQFALVRMKTDKGNEWLLLKKKDEAAQAGWDIERHAWSVLTGRTQDEIAHNLPPRREVAAPPGAVEAPMPDTVAPMLASLAEQAPVSGGWIYEVKWDGVRALCHLRDGASRFFGRKGPEITRQYPELEVVARQLDATTAILDGEIAAIDENGRPSFGHIQPRIMASGAHAIAQLARSRPVVFFVFDLLYWNGYDLRNTPLAGRRRLLESILRPAGPVKLSENFRTDPRELLAAVRAQGMEGIVAKLETGVYRSGRSRDWLKIKATREQDFVICGYTEGERDFFGALVLGAYDGGALVFTGSVGTGFDRKLMRKIRERLDALRTDPRPFAEEPALAQPATWTKPELVCTVRYLEWTHEKRLRAPVFVGLRDDVDPRECRLDPEAESPPVRPPLFPPDKDQAAVTVDGHRFLVRNLSKVFYPDEGYTKRDVLEYYDAVADLLIPHWKDRPLSLRRYPDGIAKEGFFQKNAAESKLPPWVRTQTILAEDGKERLQVIGDGRAALLYLANLGCIDQNPWMSRVDSLDHPDFLLIDLDPHECGFDKIVEAALFLRRKLDLLELEGYPKTTGGDGMHIYVPLEPVYTYDQTRAFTEILARLAASERPDLFTVPRAVGRRESGKVYFDYVQNARGKTISAPYVLRANPRAPVATPLAWSEVQAGLDPHLFHIRNAMARFAANGDLFAPVLTKPQRLEPALERLEAIARSLAG